MRLRNIVLSATLGSLLVGVAIAAETSQAYSVQKGDGLDAIARKHHTSRATLLRLNPLLAPDNLVVGDAIRVPTTTSSPERSDRARVRRTTVHAAHVSTRMPASANAPSQTVQPKALTVVQSAPRPTPAPIAKPVSVTAQAAKKAVPKPDAAVNDPYKYDEPKKNDSELPIGRVIVDLIWKLAVVLGIAYLAIYVLRGIMGRQVGLPGQKGHLKVLESATLGPNRAVHLVRVGSKILVLGSTPDQITAIGEVGDDEISNLTTPAPTPQGFSSHLADAVSGEKGGALPEEFHGGILHIWDRVQEIRGLRGRGPRA